LEKSFGHAFLFLKEIKSVGRAQSKRSTGNICYQNCENPTGMENLVNFGKEYK
jgi:hypothetical protein